VETLIDLPFDLLSFRRMCGRLVAVATLTVATWGAGPSWAAEIPSQEPVDPAGIVRYWTPQRLQQARHLSLPQVGQRFADVAPADAVEAAGDAVVEEGQGPVVRVRPDLVNHLFAPDTSQDREETDADEGGITPQDAGTYGAPFSSSRLIPLSADREYPYGTVGKLFFTIPGQGDYVCSASVLRPRVVLTAGHCVHSGTSAGFYTNWLFIPAFRDGTAPYQSWPWAYVITTSTWATGGGTVPNAADYAIIEVQDVSVSGTVRRIGDVVGYLGYQTLSLAGNHAHLLGYPCNLDSCQKQHQVTAEAYRSVSPNNVEYGSDMRGGSSGGPWVQNFGLPADGQTGGVNPGFNRIIGVTSYGYNSTDPKVQGASILDNRFLDILSTACGHRAGNC
jgi:V8-like Glu-specific endopeptidase